MARRRRSASDTFEENGIQIIKSYLSNHKHEVRVVDWATDEGFQSLSPGMLRKLNRFIIEKMMDQTVSRFTKGLLAATCTIIQGILSGIQWLGMAIKLRRLAVETSKKQLRFFGIKVWYGEAFYWSKYLTGQIKRVNPECIVIGGGYHASLYEEDILNYSNFDLAVISRGKEVLLSILNLAQEMMQHGVKPSKNELLRRIQTEALSSNLPGVLYRNGHIIEKAKGNLNLEIESSQAAIPQYDKNNGKTKVHILLDSLGCPWGKCNFCVHNQFTPSYQAFEIEAILNEIKLIMKQGIALFRFTGSDTTYTHGKALAEGIISRGYKIEYSMGARAVRNCSAENSYKSVVEAYTMMIKAGLRAVFIGGECGNDAVNHDIMNKGVRSEDLISTIKAIREASSLAQTSIAISLALIYPTPLLDGVTNDEVLADNLSLLKATLPDSAVISPPGPFKKSKWYEEKERFGFELSDSIIQTFMEYEYVLYKPLTMWPEIGIFLNGKGFKEVLAESNRFQTIVEKELGIPCNLCDEHFMMMRAAGIQTKEEVKRFKKESLLSIVSADGAYLQQICRKVNEHSNSLAMQNLSIMN